MVNGTIAKLLNLDWPIVSVDTETTGFDEKNDRIVQIGYVRVAVDGSTEERQITLDPERDIPSKASKVHGLYGADVEGKPKFRDISEDLLKVLNADIVGFNVRFDCLMLYHEFLRVGVKWVPRRMHDAFKIYQKYNPRDLTSAVRYYLEEEMQNAHTALADARYTLRVFEAQFERHEDLPRSLPVLHKLFMETPPEGYADQDRKLTLGDKGELGFNFGKYKGRTFEEVKKIDEGYFNWILDKDFTKQVKDVIQRWRKGL